MVAWNDISVCDGYFQIKGLERTVMEKQEMIDMNRFFNAGYLLILTER